MYEGMTRDYVNKEVDNEIGAPIRRRLQIREVLDGLMARYYNMILSLLPQIGQQMFEMKLFAIGWAS